MERKQEKREEYAVILDFLPHGEPFDKRPSHMKTALAQAIGKENFTLLELVPRRDIFLKPTEEVYIGEGKREKIHHIKRKLSLGDLTITARSELEHLLKLRITDDEKRFVDFFNTAGPLTMRMHQLELLPGLGKKHTKEILEQRRERLFESFDDLKRRVKLMPDPAALITKRILAELDGTEKHKLFVL